MLWFDFVSDRANTHHYVMWSDPLIHDAWKRDAMAGVRIEWEIIVNYYSFSCDNCNKMYLLDLVRFTFAFGVLFLQIIGRRTAGTLQFQLVHFSILKSIEPFDKHTSSGIKKTWFLCASKYQRFGIRQLNEYRLSPVLIFNRRWPGRLRTLSRHTTEIVDEPRDSTI